MRLFNLKIRYAEFDPADNELIYGVEETKKLKYKYNGVYYSENNNILFISKDYDIENPDESIFKQVFRYLQSNNPKGRNNTLNILTDYLAYLAAGNKVHKITDDKITISTISEELDKFSMSLAAEMVTLCTEAEIVEGTLVDLNLLNMNWTQLFHLKMVSIMMKKKIIVHYIKAQELSISKLF